MMEGRAPDLNEAARESLARIIRFAGWLPKDTKSLRGLHDAVRDLQAAADSGIALRDAFHALELSEQQVRSSSIVTLLRRSIGELRDQFEARGVYALDESSQVSPHPEADRFEPSTNSRR